jgi:mRNA interferase MazF
MTCSRGDVLLLLFPDSNLMTAKPRPALVVQANQLGTGLSQLVVAMVTSNLARGGHPSRVAVTLASPLGKASGLRTDSVVMTDNLATVMETRIHRVLGALPDMRAIDAALRHTLSL